MGTGNLAVSIVRRIIGAFIGIVAVAVCVIVWYIGGFMTVSESFHEDEIPINNVIYMLDAGDNVKQGFVPRDKHLTGIEVMLVNTSSESTGDIVVQILDMWGDAIGEGRLSLSEAEAGVYVTVPLKADLNQEESEGFQVCIFSENAETVPGVILISSEEDFEDNMDECFYNEERVWDNGLVVGYSYGEKEFVGYKYQAKDIIWTTAAKIAAVLLCGIVLIYFVQVVQAEKIKEFFFDYEIFIQITVISGFMGAFFLAAIINKMNTDLQIPVWAYGALFVPLLLFMWSIVLYMKAIRKRRHKRSAYMKAAPKIDTYTLIILGVCLIMRLPMFTQLQRWDGGVYYAVLHEAGAAFNFTFDSVWNNFRLASHPTFSYTFFMLIGEFLFPAKVTGVLLVTLVMTAAALVFIYRMLRGYWCRMPDFPALIFTLIISVIPLFMGTSSYVNVDYTLVLFFIFLTYAEYREQKIMMAFWTVALMLNKETGWIIVAGYYIVYLIKLWMSAKSKKIAGKIAIVFSDGIVRVMVVGILVVCAYMIRQGGLTGWYGVGTTSSLFVSGETIAQKGLGVNAFGFYPAYIFHRLAQIFVLNFMWIPTLIIIISSVIIIRKPKKKRKTIRNVSGMAGALILFVLFSIFYVAEALSRYTVFSTVTLWLLALILLYFVLSPMLSGEMMMGISTVMAVILLIQNFIYIDPLSNLIFDKIPSGKGAILSTNMNASYYGDSLVNSYRYAYLDKLLDKMLADAEYSEEKQIVLWSGSEDQSFISTMFSYYLGWDTEKEKRVIIAEDTLQSETAVIPLNTITMEEIQQGVELRKETILYFLPYYERDEEAYLAPLRAYYQISERKEISNWGGSLAYYVLTP